MQIRNAARSIRNVEETQDELSLTKDSYSLRLHIHCSKTNHNEINASRRLYSPRCPLISATKSKHPIRWQQPLTASKVNRLKVNRLKVNRLKVNRLNKFVHKTHLLEKAILKSPLSCILLLYNLKHPIFSTFSFLYSETISQLPIKRRIGHKLFSTQQGQSISSSRARIAIKRTTSRDDSTSETDQSDNPMREYLNP